MACRPLSQVGPKIPPAAIGAWFDGPPRSAAQGVRYLVAASLPTNDPFSQNVTVPRAKYSGGFARSGLPCPIAQQSAVAVFGAEKDLVTLMLATY
jgi:hypothetical protein